MRRLRPVSVLIVGLLALGACSDGGVPPQPTFNASQVTLTAVDAREAARRMAGEVRPLTLPPTALMSESSWAWPRVHADYPVIETAPALSTRLRTQVDSWRRDYTGAVGGTTRADLAVTWSAIVNHDGLYGIRLGQTVVAADASSSTRTFYGSGTKVWSSLDLVRPELRSTLTATILRQAKLEPEEAAGIAPGEVLTDISFAPDGSMLVHIPEGVIAASVEGGFVATVKNPQSVLSTAGQQVRQAARTTPTSTPSSPPVNRPAEPDVDCTRAKCIALTFDDGPGPYTNRLLDILETEHARATFFMVGTSVAATPSTVRRMASLGMGLGNHTWNHPDLSLLDDADVTSQITRTADAIKAATGGQAPVAVRPPYGATTKSTPHAGYPFVLWDVDTEDWRTHSAAETTKRAVSGAHPGAIILMHDIHSSTVDAVPGIITQLKKQGYTFVTVDKLVGHLDPQKSYYSQSSSR